MSLNLSLEAFYKYWQEWPIQVFCVVLATLLLRFVVGQFLKKLKGKTQVTRTPWDDSLILSISQPLTTLILIYGLSFGVDLVYTSTGNSLFAHMALVRKIALIGCCYWFASSFIDQLRNELVRRSASAEDDLDYDLVNIKAIAQITKLALLVTAILVMLQTAGISISGILAVGGVGSLVAGFAAKDLLANFFGGLLIYLDRPFTEGDWILSPDREIEGVVEKVSWRMTLIRAFDSSPLYVPNSVFTTVIVKNPSRMRNRRIFETIGIRYDDISVMDDIVAQVKSMLKNHADLDTSVGLIVNFNTFNDSSLDFFVYTFTKTREWGRFHEVKQDVLLQIGQIIEANGAEIAFPTNTLHIQKSAE